jgi:cytochrome c
MKSLAITTGRLLAAFSLFCLATPGHAVDAAGAEKLVNDNKCVKCHAIDRKKDGPAYRDVAAKFRTEADAEAKIVHHVTSGEMVKFPDGHEERHKKVKVASPAELDNLVKWILSLEGGKTY